jgi:hypothetical protein
MDSGELAGAVGCHGMTRSRTEGVVRAALRAATPVERAERRADRANMVT